LWSVDQIAQLITTHESRVHKMKKNNEHKNVHSEILYIKRKAKNQKSVGRYIKTFFKMCY